MEIMTFKPDYAQDMAVMFVQNFRQLRATTPILPDLMEDAHRVTEKLSWLSTHSPGVVALDGGKVVGYMGWFWVRDFRKTGRKGAFCAEWAHGTLENSRPAIYRALYRAAARIWSDNGIGVHGLALLAHDSAAQNVWFWNGFGLTVVDAIRSTDPLGIVLPTDFTVRKATLNDLDALAVMEIEHRQHYLEPPVLMEAYHPVDAAGLAKFLAEPQNSIWLALDGEDYMGYLRFMVDNEDSAAIVVAPDRIANTGAYIRPQYRGRKAAPAVLDAALRDYAARGFKRCSVDFESFNPEAAAFWMRYFQPVCYSVTRIPERQPRVD